MRERREAKPGEGKHGSRAGCGGASLVAESGFVNLLCSQLALFNLAPSNSSRVEAGADARGPAHVRGAAIHFGFLV